MNTTDQAWLEHATAVVRGIIPRARPLCGIVMGSGWSSAADIIEPLAEIPFSDIPGLGAGLVAGHPGRLRWGRFAGCEVLCFLGRRHWYEGLGWGPVAFPVYLARALAARGMLLTNAAGGIRDDLAPGKVVIIEDHINAMGVNPLTGPHDPAWGPRFPDQHQVYDQTVADAVRQAAGDRRTLSGGVYLATSGPVYETPAEIRAFRAWGADIIGMSTVPEAVLARAAGLQVFALSCVANRAAGFKDAAAADHQAVMRVMETAAPDLRWTLQAALSGMLAACSKPEREPSP